VIRRLSRIRWHAKVCSDILRDCEVMSARSVNREESGPEHLTFNEGVGRSNRPQLTSFKEPEQLEAYPKNRGSGR